MSAVAYLDNQASTAVDATVASLMAAYSQNCFGNPHSSGHSVGWTANSTVEVAKQRVAALISADTEEIIFTSGATESNNLAILGLRKGVHNCRRRVLRTPIEHKSVISACRYLVDDLEFDEAVIPVDSEGVIDLVALEITLRSGATLCSIGLVNSEIGSVQDAAKIAELCREYGVFLHIDAAQASTSVDMEGLASHADLISLSAHKMYGPMGIGALFVSRNVREYLTPLMYGGSQQDGLRPGTLPVPLCLGMGQAASICGGESGELDRTHVRNLRDRFVNRLVGKDGSIILNGPALDRRHPGNANLQFVGLDAQEILGALQPHVAASSGSACMSGIPEPSYVLRAIGLSADQANSSLRFSFGKGNTVEEVDRSIELIMDAVGRVASHSVG